MLEIIEKIATDLNLRFEIIDYKYDYQIILRNRRGDHITIFLKNNALHFERTYCSIVGTHYFYTDLHAKSIDLFHDEEIANIPEIIAESFLELEKIGNHAGWKSYKSSQV